MLILGIDPGILNCGWCLVDIDRFGGCSFVNGGVISPPSNRKRKTVTGPRGGTKREVVPGSVSSSENDTQRSGQIFVGIESIVDVRRNAKPYQQVRCIVVEDRTLNAVWATGTKMTQQGVLTAVECVARLHGLPRDLVPVKKVHSALGIKIPRGKDAKSYVDAAVRERMDCNLLDALVKAKGKRQHIIDAAAAAMAAVSMEGTKTHSLMEEVG